jgi:hypothetical protein
VDLNNFDDFVKIVLDAGFSMGGGNAEGIFSAVPFPWGVPAPFPTRVRWHTGDAETDPWEWRLRVLAERDDIAYGKLFFKKSGFITRAWYPYFLAARRGRRTFDEAYMRGTVSHMAKRVYAAARERDGVPAHELRALVGVGKADKPASDAALVELQGRLFLTVSGGQQKTSRAGEAFGWVSTSFCTTEAFWGEEVFDEARDLDAGEAEDAITRRVLELNPAAEAKKIKKFIAAAR